jgi:carboxylesterase
VNTDLSLYDGGSPFYLPGNSIGVVLTHGITGTPCNMRWLADHLHESLGCTIYAPRLTGHGTHPADMRGVRWEQWYYDVLSAYSLLRERCKKVFVGGLSMGALLSLTLAAREPVDGVIAMSTPYEITDWRVPFLPLIKYVLPYPHKVVGGA